MKQEKQEKAIRNELIDEMLKRGRTAGDVNGILKQLTNSPCLKTLSYRSVWA